MVLPLNIKKVGSHYEMATFLKVSGEIQEYRGKKPETGEDTIANYNPGSNPVHRRLKTGYFVAFREKIPVGRIAAIKDFLNPDSKTGLFGCFECRDDAGAASSLVEAARKWLIENGCPRMIGPATFNTNQKVGMLVEGYEYGPQPMLPYNPPYYNRLMELSGLVKHTDLLTFVWNSDMGIPERVRLAAAKVRRTKDVKLRKFNLMDIPYEAHLIRDLFNGSMSANWGFTPLTLDESAGMLHYCRNFADRDLMATVWLQGKPVGLLLFLPIGSPGPTSPTSIRAAILGVLPQYRHRGLDLYIIEHMMKTVISKGYRDADLSLIHEENAVVLKFVTRAVGALLSRRFRVYGNTPPEMAGH